MKKKLAATMALSLCLALVATMAYADDEKSTFNFGPKAGVTLNYQWGGDLPNISTFNDLGDLYAGFSAGLFLRIRFLSFLMLQPEILYSQQGSSGLHIDYIEIPVLLKLGLPLGNFTPNVFAGPVGAFRVNDDNSNPLIDVKDALFSLAMGVSCDIDIGKFLLTLEGRWTFSPMDSITTNTILLDDSMKNGTGSFMVGFGF